MVSIPQILNLSVCTTTDSSSNILPRTSKLSWTAPILQKLSTLGQSCLREATSLTVNRPQRNSLGRSASQVATTKRQPIFTPLHPSNHHLANITTEYIPQERPSITTPKETPQPVTQVDNTTAITSTANVAGTATTQSVDAPERALAPTEAQKGDANDFFLKRAQAMAEDPPKDIISPSTAPSLDIDPATLDAAAVYDIDINAIDSEKPWRQPGADLTDWFNYGFDEYKWLDYASRKKNLGSTVEKINPFAVR